MTIAWETNRLHHIQGIEIMKRKRNPHSDVEQMKEALFQIRSNLSPIPFKYISGVVSTLGGVHRPTILLKVSLQSKDEWKNGYIENSPYAQINIGYDGVIEMFSGCLKPKLRKTTIDSTQEALNVLAKWGSKVLHVKPF